MRVVLLNDLRNKGKRGDVVSVKPGFARNYLLPNGLAMVATDGNLKIFAQQRKKFDQIAAKEREGALELAGALANVKLKIAKRVGETQTLYGSVTSSEIAELLAEKGINIDRRKLDLPAGIKSLGDHKVRVDLHPDVVGELTVTVVPEE
jgi:large subunit ribosomal protein L9